jgi:hypothetical protein
MDIEIKINDASLGLEIENPHRVDMTAVMAKVEEFAKAAGAALPSSDVMKLIPRMIKGVKGCEGGCPSDAKSLARNGFVSCRIEYVEGGILTATRKLDDGKTLEIKIFPDF